MRTFDQPGFVTMCSRFDNKYRVPCRQTVANKLIPERFELLKEHLLEICNVIEYCSMTTDGWKSQATQGYIDLNIHYVDEDFELKLMLLSFKHFPADHSSQNICHHIQDLLQEWKIDRKVLYIYLILFLFLKGKNSVILTEFFF